MNQKNLINPRINLRKFVSGEEGALTTLGLFLFLTILVFGGISVDVANAYKSRTELQVAADAAAHAAIYTRELGTIEEARSKAIEVVEETLLTEYFGETLRPEDIQFGSWDRDAEVFTIDNDLKDAVMVNTARLASRGNSVPSFLLSLIGIDEWNVKTGAVYETYIPACLREGFVAESVVDMQSNNNFTNGFCVHSNAHVELNSNNAFGDTTIVSMPDKSQIVIPNNGWESNDGLAEALRDNYYTLRIVTRLPDIIQALYDGDPNYIPDYITGSANLTLSATKVDATDFTPGRVHTKSCGGGNTLTISGDTVLTNVVLVTNCKIKFGSNVTLENVIIATTNTDIKSVSTAAGLQIGRDDSCAADGGSQILTLGGFSAPANLRAYGGQIIAVKDITFAANANGIEGASFISGGKIDGTSNTTMGFCGSGYERNFEAQYFHLRY